MSAVSYLRSEAQFLCSICLDVFTDPVTTLCGHRFCKNCITQHWDTGQRCQCPMCKETFCTRPQLRVNTLISEMVAQFRREAQQNASSSTSEQQAAKPREVPCDVCTGTRLKALKSCLVCLDSYCQTHLEPHLTASRLKRHQLVEPVENLEDKVKVFLQLIQACRLPPRLIRKLGLTFPKTSSNRRYGNVPFQYHDTCTLPATEETVLTAAGHEILYNLERFSPCIIVLGKESFSSGRFYFEVQVKGKTEWDLGVARESIKRKGQLILCPQNGFWTLWLRNGNEYGALTGSPLPLSLQSGPEKVGVFVDYEEGLISFYDVDAGAHMYSFTGCSFTQKLYPYFSPGLHHNGRNSAPLIICPVNQTD